MGVTFPFFVFVSTMGVLISLVAIPLRENVPDFALLFGPNYRAQSNRRFRLDPSSKSTPRLDFKLLKFRILRVDLRLHKLYHKKSSATGHLWAWNRTDNGWVSRPAIATDHCQDKPDRIDRSGF